MQFPLKIPVVLLIFYWIVSGCATPTQPTGGPADTNPPVITRTEPQNGTVNFDGDEIRFYFDKYVNRESFKNALRIDPDLALRYEVSWRGRSVRVSFDEPLPDSTTIIFTIGTEFSDVSRNRLTRPYVLALSTGPTIDEGEIKGKVRDGSTGRGKDEAYVLLYRIPYDLERTADFVAETDTSGQVNFGYLADGSYKAFWVDDRNRNRRWDRDREAARPFYVDTVNVRQDRPVDLGTMYIKEPDTLRPELQGVGMFSSQRMRLRYSRNMLLHDDGHINVLDTLGNVFTEAVPLYVDPGSGNIVFAQARESLPEDQEFELQVRGLTDRNGNLPTDESPRFTGSAASDTTRIRKIRHLTSDGVMENEPHVFQFSTLIEGTEIVDSLQVVRDEVVYTEWEPIGVEDNLLFVYPPEKWNEGSSYTARIYKPDRGSFENISLPFWSRSRLGGVDLSIHEDDIKAGVKHHIRVINRDGVEFFSGTAEESIEITGLPSGTYSFIMFRDDDGSGDWFPGSVEPFKPAEPYHVERGIRIHERMTGDLVVRYLNKPGAEPVEDQEIFDEELPDEIEESENQNTEEPEPDQENNQDQ